MKAALAKRLTADLMKWDDERATNEFAWLELMVDYKFDHYQGYGPGHRFYVHLLRWLSQFAPAERELAYGLLRNRLVYISQDEMHHLVARTGPLVDRQMRAAVARKFGIPVYKVDFDPRATKALALMRARTLYVGVSDGARIDVFRRYNEGQISNEQVVPMIEISVDKQKKLGEKLQERLLRLGEQVDAEFEWVCLIDDFTASGTTSIRFDEEKQIWDGKVPRFMAELVDVKEGMANLIANNAHILVHHYLASARAERSVRDLIHKYGQTRPGLRFIADFSYVLPESIVINSTSARELAQLLNTRYDPSVETKQHTKRVALGYKEGGLPLVLDHNTPNNSVGTLWARSDPTKDNYVMAHHMWPLFPRRQRHSDVG